MPSSNPVDRWTAIKKHSAALTRDIKKVKAKILRDVRQQNRVATTAQRRMCLIIFFVSGWNAHSAAAYLTLQRRQKDLRDIDANTLQRHIEDWFLETPETDVVSWATPANDDVLGHRRLQAAKKHIKEWKLKQWLYELNTSRGIGPTSRRVMQEYNDIGVSEDPFALRRPARTYLDCERQWVHRWRRRWGARIVKVQAHDRRPPSELQPKVLVNGVIYVPRNR
jgi:hypothetical protein